MEFEGIGPGPMAEAHPGRHGGEVVALVRPNPRPALSQGGSLENPLCEGKQRQKWSTNLDENESRWTGFRFGAEIRAGGRRRYG